MQQKIEINRQAMVEVEDEYVELYQRTCFMCDAALALLESASKQDPLMINGFRLEAQGLKLKAFYVNTLLDGLR